MFERQTLKSMQFNENYVFMFRITDTHGGYEFYYVKDDFHKHYLVTRHRKEAEDFFKKLCELISDY